MEILEYPNPALKVGAQDVDPTTDDTLLELVKTMARAMYDAPGVGLAAPQIGVMKRVIVYDLEDEKLVALCNPRIISRSEDTALDDEGCLSFPGISIPIERHLAVTCEAVDIKGNPVRIEAEGLHARALQHEIDHIDGVLIIDRATEEERKAALRRYQEIMSAAR